MKPKVPKLQHEVTRNQWAPLHVGDSLIIIRQDSTRQPPLAKHMKDIYWQSRRVAEQLGVFSWQHHLRAYNKMADTFANIAMDSKISAQRAPNSLQALNPQWTAAAAHAHNDVGHWIARNLIEGTSEPAAATV
ncbi:hypothetical protein PHYSODRAFT_531838 [Phytophthora sojae]|uniref:RNase H type-1 domain-containing protein n=1 Tax=Phytophthora sojae (strain P6497) TaxID=1094619 RepID=G5AEF8_PHYSP|nr:hypothetical protein PHYSODRAFT_531838 [Phytophthora sojae]EGZ06560.1 hypothetical protein PHYSODRAFT_531838 [Phytophthora sojae]|eukprot:XP_009538457.1 hypothetical protein PHYSODRAFT_531838 [Phytophthora sojae]